MKPLTALTAILGLLLAGCITVTPKSAPPPDPVPQLEQEVTQAFQP